MLLMYRKGLVFDKDEPEVSIHLTIVEETATELQTPRENSTDILAIAPRLVWSHIKANRSDVYLHVLAIQDGHEVDEISSSLIRSGSVLYGAINMIKYDVIPRHFRHRYLLTDWGIGAMTALDGTTLLSLHLI